MKHSKNIILSTIFILSCTVSTYAQYGGGFGNGYGGYGGRGNNSMMNSGFDNGKPKPPPDPDEVAKEETRMMVKKFKLDEEQEILISSLNEDYAYQRKDLYERIKKDFGLTQPTPAQITEARGKMEALEAKKDKELEKIFTPEQFKNYQKVKAKAQKGKKNQ
ncbi:MAG: hypothetical protein U5M51_10000 [Emticicia sp.]|nr:hypothetical protein [Emticicia sp.]